MLARCTVKEREGLWEALLLDKTASMPWFVVGDFNVIVHGGEKRAGDCHLPPLKCLNF